MKQTVYISAYLKDDVSNKVKYSKRVYHQLKNIDEIDLIEIQNHTNNVWCRDYMPVKSSSGKYIKFSYQPSYMMDSAKLKNKIPHVETIHQEIELDCEFSDIILDGGAIEIHGKKGIVSDRVFRDNFIKSEVQIYNEIKEKLELDQLIVIPQYPYDFTGHVDGLVRFIDENNVVVNDLNKEQKENSLDTNSYRKKLIESWIYAFKGALINAGLKMHYIPTSIPENGSPNSGEGIYINFLLLNEFIIMPVYNKPEDNESAQIIESLYHKKVKKVYATELSKEGGMINCVTWTK